MILDKKEVLMSDFNKCNCFSPLLLYLIARVHMLSLLLVNEFPVYKFIDYYHHSSRQWFWLWQAWSYTRGIWGRSMYVASNWLSPVKVSRWPRPQEAVTKLSTAPTKVTAVYGNLCLSIVWFLFRIGVP